MEATKRKYTKSKTEGKITVKHFLNTKLKSVPNEKSFKDGKERFAIYVRLMVMGKNLEIKSKIRFPIAIDEFDNVLREKKDLFNREIIRITDIIKRHKPFESTTFRLNGVSIAYNNLTIPLNLAIENCLRNEIRKSLVSLGTYRDEMKGYKIEEMIDPETLKPNESYKDKLRHLDVSNQLLKTLNWDSKAFELINILMALESIKGFEEFIKLYKNYESLWQFDRSYNLLNQNYFEDLEPTPIEWFETNSIQTNLKKIYPSNADTIINQITNLLNHYKA
nr:hypothetical protein [uncultured Emticicia sp.]